MSNEIYQAFVNAGFKKEAIRLSETVKTKDGPKIRPALGHYIAILDAFKGKPFNYPKLEALAKYSIMNFLSKNSEKINEGLFSDCEDKLEKETRLSDINFLDKFIEHYKTKC